MAQLTVKAAPGLRVPMEGAPREYITDGEAVPVARSPYYLRRLAEGDLVEAGEAPAAPVVDVNDTPATGDDTDVQPDSEALSATVLKAGKKKATQESAS
ncbi:DUF2635 domain-containing protein [Serratia marcescens]|uniref:DUF2635 domain-containing protein n=1 Tax=Serratia marcescens TaxID=615 RepID=UPI001BAF8610|nr:DUF2635 domain-containing protein [Serratia marcescens]MBS3893083.1 DUF2635 domain-containing protein [Serratia marcescens]